MMVRACCNCEYHGDKGCHFPDPQRGGPPPFMATAAMPDTRNGGAGCVQYRAPSRSRKEREPSA